MHDDSPAHFSRRNRKMFLLLMTFCLISISAIVHAQYTDATALKDLGGPDEFARRRTELSKQLKDGYAVLFARDVIPEATHYREDNDFYYFTGIRVPYW
jgi:hypothetical protein